MLLDAISRQCAERADEQQLTTLFMSIFSVFEVSEVNRGNLAL